MNRCCIINLQVTSEALSATPTLTKVSLFVTDIRHGHRTERSNMKYRFYLEHKDLNFFF